MRLAIKQKQLGMESKTKLVQDVCTRWNSSFDMIDSIIKNYAALKSIVADAELVTDINNNQLSKQIIKENKTMANNVSKNLPGQDELIGLKYLLRILKPLKDITCDLSGSKYVTASMLFPAIYTLVNYELATVFDDIEKSRVPAEIETIRLKLISCLKQRFDFLLNNNDTSKVYWAMTFLDCRFKGFSFISKIEERKAKLQIAKEFLETYYATLPEKTSSPEKIVSQSDDTPTCAQPEVNAGNKRDRPSYLKNILDKRFSESVLNKASKRSLTNMKTIIHF